MWTLAYIDDNGDVQTIHLTRDDVANMFHDVDPATYKVRTRLERFLIDIDWVSQGHIPFTLIAPLGTSREELTELGLG